MTDFFGLLMNEGFYIESIVSQAPPVCDDSGFYAPLQCQPGGLCRCVDKYTGDPVSEQLLGIFY